MTTVIVTVIIQSLDTATVSYVAYGIDSHPWGIPGPDDTGETPTLISNLGLLTLGFGGICYPVERSKFLKF